MTDCPKCHQPHVAALGGRPCKGHPKSHMVDGVRVWYPDADRPPCRRNAMDDQDVCPSHGGKAPQNLAAADRRRTERKAAKIMARFAGPLDVTPSESLLDSIRWTAGYVQFLREQVERVTNTAEDADDLIWGKTKTKTGGEDYGTTEEAKPSVWDGMLREWQRELSRMCVEAIKIGIEERRVRLAESQGAMVAEAMRGTADAILKALLAAGMADKFAAVFQAALAQEAPRHLRLLAGGAA